MPKHEVVLLPAAFADLDEIFDYILADNPLAAAGVLDAIMQSLERLEEHPHSGALLQERSLNRLQFRMVIVTPYIAFYRVIGQRVFVYRVLHGARDYQHLLKDTTDD